MQMCNVKQSWPLRTGIALGQNNIKNEPLEPSEKIILSPSLTKLGLIKNFVKVVLKDEDTVFSQN